MNICLFVLLTIGFSAVLVSCQDSTTTTIQIPPSLIPTTNSPSTTSPPKDPPSSNDSCEEDGDCPVNELCCGDTCYSPGPYYNQNYPITSAQYKCCNGVVYDSVSGCCAAPIVDGGSVCEDGRQSCCGTTCYIESTVGPSYCCNGQISCGNGGTGVCCGGKCVRDVIDGYCCPSNADNNLDTYTWCPKPQVCCVPKHECVADLDTWKAECKPLVAAAATSGASSTSTTTIPTTSTSTTATGPCDRRNDVDCRR